MDRNEFIGFLAPIVVRVRQEGSYMFPSVRLAQNILETGGTIPSWNNLGGIKVGSGKPNMYWKGAYVVKGTWEVYDGSKKTITAAFRAYEGVYEFYKDQDLLMNLARYKPVIEAQTPRQQAQALYACGYATDPDYAAKITRLIEMYNLTKYDEEAKVKMEKSIANQIIVILQREWVNQQSAADKQRIHELANALRAASGQPLT